MPDSTHARSCLRSSTCIGWSLFLWENYLDVSKNNGTPKSSILIGFSINNHPFWGTRYPYFWFNTHLLKLSKLKEEKVRSPPSPLRMGCWEAEHYLQRSEAWEHPAWCRWSPSQGDWCLYGWATKHRMIQSFSDPLGEKSKVSKSDR